MKRFPGYLIVLLVWGLVATGTVFAGLSPDDPPPDEGAETAEPAGPLYEATFDARCEWSRATLDYGAGRCEGGEYRFTFTEGNHSPMAMRFEASSDEFEVAADVRFASKARAASAIVFDREQEGDSHYTFLLESDGVYSLYVWQRDEQTVLLRRPALGFAGEGQANRMRVERRGEEISLFLNDEPLGTIRHRVLDGKRIGWMMRAFDGERSPWTRKAWRRASSSSGIAIRIWRTPWRGRPGL